MINFSWCDEYSWNGKIIGRNDCQDKVHIILYRCQSWRRYYESGSQSIKEFQIRDLSPQDEWDLLENHYNRVTDICIPEEEA
jgi:hypothetical protein